MWSVMVDVLSRMVFLVLSVVNSGSFPKPLSAKEERAALAAMAAGDTGAYHKEALRQCAGPRGFGVHRHRGADQGGGFLRQQ